MSEQAEQHPTARRSSFYRGVLLTGSGAAVNIVLLFLETLLVVRWLLPADYGVYVLLVAVVNLGVVVVDLGCKTAVTQMIARGEPDRQAALASNVLAFRLVASMALSLLIWLGRDLLLVLDPSRELARYLGYVPVLLVVASYDELLSAILQGFQAYRQVATALIGRSILRLSLTVLFLGLLNLGVMALIYSWVASFVVSVAYQYLVLPLRRRPAFQPALLVPLLTFGLPLQGNRLLWFMFGRVNVFLIGAFTGPASVAFYEVAARIPEALQRLSDSYLAVYFPTVTNLLATDRRATATAMLNRSIRLIAFATALLALVAVVFAEQIVVLLFSDKYAASGLAFAVLMIAFHVTFVGNVMGYTLTAAGRPGRSFAQSLVRTLGNIIGDILLIPVLGFVGPAVATMLSAYGANPIAVYLLRRSSVAVAIVPFLRQTLLLLVIAGIFVWARPSELIYKGAIVLAFVVLSGALSTIRVDDLSLLLPAGLFKRPSLRKGLLPDGN